MVIQKPIPATAGTGWERTLDEFEIWKVGGKKIGFNQSGHSILGGPKAATTEIRPLRIGK